MLATQTKSDLPQGIIYIVLLDLRNKAKSLTGA